MRGLGEAENGVGGEGLFVAQAKPIVAGIGLAAIGKIGPGAVANEEEIAEDIDGGALTAFTQKIGDRDGEKLAEQIEQSRLDGGDGVDGGAQIEGLQTAALAVSIGETRLYLVEDGVMESERLADDERLRVFKHAVNLFSTGDLAYADVARVVGEENEIASEEWSVRAAEVEQHGVGSGNRNDAHGGDQWSLLALDLLEKRIQRSSPRRGLHITMTRLRITRMPGRE